MKFLPNIPRSFSFQAIFGGSYKWLLMILSESRKLWVFSPFWKSNLRFSENLFQCSQWRTLFFVSKGYLHIWFAYIYNLSKKNDSSWYLVLFGTQGLLKTPCLIAPAKFQRARRASDHPVRKDGQLPNIVVTCLIRGKVGSPTSLWTIFHYIHSIFWVVFAGPLFAAMIFIFFIQICWITEISSSLL